MRLKMNKGRIPVRLILMIAIRMVTTALAHADIVLSLPVQAVAAGSSTSVST
jgi:hypothetical protein